MMKKVMERYGWTTCGNNKWIKKVDLSSYRVEKKGSSWVIEILSPWTLQTIKEKDRTDCVETLIRLGVLG